MTNSTELARTSFEAAADVNKPLTILQVHSADLGGGAEEMAYMMHKEFTKLGHNSRFLVGSKLRGDPTVQELPANQRWRGEHRVKRFLENAFGLQYLFAPGSSYIRELCPEKPSVVLIHSMHGSGGYFDIADLASISRKQPTFVYLQDQWLMTGHCAYSLGCERWQTGCGNCPDLSIYPSLRKDGTNLNWRRKRWSLARSTIHVGSPARWILDLAKKSPILSQFEQYYVPNAVDTDVFCPGDKRIARIELGLEPDRQLILFLAQKGTRSVFKDFETMAAAFRILRAQGHTAGLLTVGGLPDDETRKSLPEDVKFEPFTTDRSRIANYYRAADIFCHATKADVCPLTILEALACGTPVLATRVGGVPEIIDDGVNGWTVESMNVDAMTDRLNQLLSEPERLIQMGKVAARMAATKYCKKTIAAQFVSLFRYGISTSRGI